MTVGSCEFESHSLHKMRKCAAFAEIAQLVEHNLAKVGVASSSLVFRSQKVLHGRHWKGGRVVDYSGLENRRAERHRGFESLPFRREKRAAKVARFICWCQRKPCGLSMVMVKA